MQVFYDENTISCCTSFICCFIIVEKSQVESETFRFSLVTPKWQALAIQRASEMYITSEELNKNGPIWFMVTVAPVSSEVDFMQ